MAFFCCSLADAQIHRKLNYQGFLTSPSGAPVNSAGLQMVFNIHNVATLGAPLHTETQTVTVSDGIFNVLLGTGAALTLPFDAQYYLGVTPGADPEMSPRQPLAASPYAVRAATVESADALATGGSVVIGATTTQPFPSRLQVVTPTAKTTATLGIRGLSVTSNETTAPSRST